MRKTLIFAVLFLAVATPAWCKVFVASYDKYSSDKHYEHNLTVKMLSGGTALKDYAEYSQDESQVCAYTNLWSQTIFLYKGKQLTVPELNAMAKAEYARKQSAIAVEEKRVHKWDWLGIPGLILIGVIVWRSGGFAGLSPSSNAEYQNACLKDQMWRFFYRQNRD